MTATEFIISKAKLLFLAADGGGTLRVFEYAQGDAASWGGRRLLPRGAFHTGALAAPAVLRPAAALPPRSPLPHPGATLAPHACRRPTKT